VIQLGVGRWHRVLETAAAIEQDGPLICGNKAAFERLLIGGNGGCSFWTDEHAVFGGDPCVGCFYVVIVHSNREAFALANCIEDEEVTDGDGHPDTRGNRRGTFP